MNSNITCAPVTARDFFNSIASDHSGAIILAEDLALRGAHTFTKKGSLALTIKRIAEELGPDRYTSIYAWALVQT